MRKPRSVPVKSYRAAASASQMQMETTMIRRLMASSAILALMTAGAWSAEPTKQPTDANEPAAVQDNTTGGASADQAAPVTPVPNTAEAADKPAATTDMAAGADKGALQPEKPTLATAFIGRSVFTGEDPNAENIGDVNDLIIDDNGAITQAVIGVGGFLGIGEKDVAVPFDDLQVVERDGDIRLIYSASKEQLENAQAFDRTAYDPSARAPKQQAATETTGTGLTPAPATDQTATTTATPAPAPTTDTAATETTPVPAPTTEQTTAATETKTPAADQNMAGGDTTKPAAHQNMAAYTTAKTGPEPSFISFSADQVRASSMIGQDVYGPDNKSIGKVADLVLQEDGKTRAALIDVGGFLGVGSKRIAIPFADIKVAPDKDNPDKPLLNVAMTKDQMQQAPEWQDRTAASTTAPATDQPATTGSTTTTTASDKTAGAMAPATQDLSADKLIGTAVYSPDQKNLGEVGDVVFDKGGDIKGVVIDVGGFLGVGEKPVGIQYDALNVQKDMNGDMRLMVNASEDQLKSAPTFSEKPAQ
jgi:sporulation protein YlmC with PRC-barrel domain